MFKNADNLSKLAAPPIAPVVEPFKPTVVPAGFAGVHTLAIQIAITQWRGKLTGAFPNTMNGKAHRLDVSRMVAFDDCTEDAFAWLKTRLGPKHEDRTLRPDDRHSLVMYRGGPHGLKDLKPWFLMYKEVSEAIAWCQEQVVISRGQDHFALVMLVSTSDWDLKKPGNPNFDPFYEAVLRGISDLEVVKLSPEPSIELPDGFPEKELVQPVETPKPRIIVSAAEQVRRKIDTSHEQPVAPGAKPEYVDSKERPGVVDELIADFVER
jgi:hypothetical protein